jgi:hypothetical protein
MRHRATQLILPFEPALPGRQLPAVKKAMTMGPEFREDPASISADEQARRRKLVADQRAQPIPSEWLRAA